MTDCPHEHIPALLQRGADDATALSTPGGNAADLSRAARARRGRSASAQRARHRRRRSRRHRARQRAGDGGRVSHDRPAATAAPLNPGYRADEFEFYLTDLAPSCSSSSKDKDSPPSKSRRSSACRSRGSSRTRSAAPERSRSSSTAHGRTVGDRRDGDARRHRAGAAHVGHDIAAEDRAAGAPERLRVGDEHPRRRCALTADDRDLVIMPLFHIHGLIAALLAPLSAGGEVCCSPGFNALKFFSWLDEVQPTWYTGVPTMHQAILLRAPNNAGDRRRITGCASFARRRRRCRRR